MRDQVLYNLDQPIMNYFTAKLGRATFASGQLLLCNSSSNPFCENLSLVKHFQYSRLSESTSRVDGRFWSNGQRYSLLGSNLPSSVENVIRYTTSESKCTLGRVTSVWHLLSSVILLARLLSICCRNQLIEN